MTIIRWQSMPQLNRMYNNLYGNDNATGFEKDCGNIPAANILENEKDYEIQLAFPGVDKKDIDISLDNNILKISYESKEPNGENYIRQEFNCESFTRSFIIPKETSIDSISASYEKGILKVSIPKVEKTKIQKSISIS